MSMTDSVVCSRRVVSNSFLGETGQQYYNVGWLEAFIMWGGKVRWGSIGESLSRYLYIVCGVVCAA